MQQNRFSSLSSSAGARDVYRSQRWTDESKRYRRGHPLCERCRAAGLVRVSNLVHHKESLDSVLARQGDPFDHQNLEALCMACHQKELNAKRQDSRVWKKTLHDIDYVMGLQKDKQL